jgi:hypothetical protein
MTPITDLGFKLIDEYSNENFSFKRFKKNSLFIEITENLKTKKQIISATVSRQNIEYKEILILDKIFNK